MSEDYDPESMQTTFERVAAYRTICQSIRETANSTLFNAILWLGLTYLLFRLTGSMLVAYMGLGIVELFIGLMKKFRPILLCVLLDGFLLLAFSAGFGYVQYERFQRGIQPNPISLIFAALWLFQGFNSIRQYFQLRSML
ncbi:MAG: hypothetical protein ACRCZF_01450, partial [Gemmataceae bacterium]